MKELQVLFGFVAAVVTVILIFFAARSDGKIDHCYIDNQNYIWTVEGHRPWRLDVKIGSASSPDEADKILRNSAICSEFLKK